jgi:hypothetical protein
MQPYSAELIACLLGLRHWRVQQLADLLRVVIEPGLRDAVAAEDPWVNGLAEDRLLIVGLPGSTVLGALASLVAAYESGELARTRAPEAVEAWLVFVHVLLLARCELVAELFFAPTRAITLMRPTAPDPAHQTRCDSGSSSTYLHPTGTSKRRPGSGPSSSTPAPLSTGPRRPSTPWPFTRRPTRSSRRRTRP